MIPPPPARTATPFSKLRPPPSDLRRSGLRDRPEGRGVWGVPQTGAFNPQINNDQSSINNVPGPIAHCSLFIVHCSFSLLSCDFPADRSLKCAHREVRRDVLKMPHIERVYLSTVRLPRCLRMNRVEKGTSAYAPGGSALDQGDVILCRESVNLKLDRQVTDHLCRMLRTDLQPGIARQRRVCLCQRVR
jgi:hypothetical protein